MKNAQKIICFAILALTFSGVFAQDMHKKWIDLTPASNTLNYKLPGKRYYLRSSFMGSKFISDKWCLTDIILENGDRYDSLQIRLNSFLDDIIVYNERVGATIVLDKSVISEFHMRFDDGHIEHFKKLPYKKINKDDRYYSILYEGKFKVYLWYKTIEEKTTVYTDIMGIMHDSVYRLTKNYFIVFPNGEMVKLVNKRRAFFELFPEQKKQVRRITRKNNILFGTQDEIIRAVKLVEKELF